MATYVERPDGVVVRYNDDTTQLIIPPNTDIPAYQDYLTWKDSTYQSEIQLRKDISNGIATNLVLVEQYAAIKAALPALLNYVQNPDPVVALGEVIGGVKQMVGWIGVLVNTQETILNEINFLGNLQLGRFDS